MSQQITDLETTRKLLQDITTLGVVDRTFDFPGREKTHKVRVGTLWEDDLIRVKERAARRSSDPLVQREVIVLETLVEAVLDIDGFAFFNAIPEVHDVLKGNLRETLKQSSPFTITALYEKYSEATTLGAEEIDNRINEIKKSSGPSTATEDSSQPTPD